MGQEEMGGVETLLREAYAAPVPSVHHPLDLADEILVAALARRRRRDMTRIVGAAAALAAVAVVLSLGVVRAGDASGPLRPLGRSASTTPAQVTTSPRSDLPTTDATSAATTVRPLAPPTTSIATAARTGFIESAPEGKATRPPSSNLLAIGDVWPAAVDLHHSFSYPVERPLETRLMAVAMGGQVCDESVLGAKEPWTGHFALAGSSRWATVGAATGGAAPSSVNFSVTVWSDSRQGWRELVTNSGYCRFYKNVSATWPGGTDDQMLRVGTDGAGNSTATAAQRVGRTIIAATYNAGERTTEATVSAEAMRLCGLLVAPVTASGLPGGH